ncbi:MAG: phage holin family protein [Bacteroidota bacterium]
MMSTIFTILASAISVMICAYFLKGVDVKSFGGAVVTAILIAIVNGTLGNVLNFFFAPVNWITFGLASAIISALMIQVVSWLYSGFAVKNFWWALIFGIVLGIVNGLIMNILPI